MVRRFILQHRSCGLHDIDLNKAAISLTGHDAHEWTSTIVSLFWWLCYRLPLCGLRLHLDGYDAAHRVTALRQLLYLPWASSALLGMR